MDFPFPRDSDRIVELRGAELDVPSPTYGFFLLLDGLKFTPSVRAFSMLTASLPFPSYCFFLSGFPLSLFPPPLYLGHHRQPFPRSDGLEVHSRRNRNTGLSRAARTFLLPCPPSFFPAASSELPSLHDQFSFLPCLRLSVHFFEGKSSRVIGALGRFSQARQPGVAFLSP